MKKKMISLVLALVLVLSLLPVLPVFAEATSYDFMVGGVSVTSDNAADVLGDGLFSYDAATNTLTVKGSKDFDVNAIVNNNPGLTIYMENDATLTSKGATTFLMFASATITGPGELGLRADGGTVEAIHLSSGTLTMDDANVHANGAGIGISGGGKLVVRNSWLSASGGHDAIAGLGDFKVEGCTLRDPSDGRIVSSGVLAPEEAYETYASFVRIEPIRYDLWIKGTQVAAVNRDDILGDGSCEYDPSNRTLYLYKDITGTADLTDNLILSATEDLTIYVCKDVLLDTGGSCIAAADNLKITGPGKLNLMGAYGIYATKDADVEINSANINAVGQYCICGGLSGTNALTVRNSSVRAAAFKEAITDFKGGITLTGCTLAKPEGGSVGAQDILNADGSVATEVTIRLPEVVSYDIWVANTEVTSQNAGNILGNGTAYYDVLRNILFVEGSIDGGGASAIQSYKPGLRIFVAKDAALSSNSDVIHVTEDATIQGTGKLTLRSTENSALFASNGACLTISDMEIDAKGAWGIVGRPAGEKLIIKNSTIHAEGENGAICDFDGGITLQGCAVITPEGGKVSGSAVVGKDNKLAKEVIIQPAEAEKYSLWVAGTQVTSFNATDVLGDGAFAYDAEKNTLTVQGSGLSNTGSMLVNRIAGLTVYVAEDAVLSSSVLNALDTNKDLTITGPGKLTLLSLTGSGILASSNATLTIENANVEASGSFGITGFIDKAKLVVRNSEVHATGSEGAVLLFSGGITLEGCDIITPAGGRIDGAQIVDKDGNLAKEVVIEGGDGLPCSGGEDCPGNVFTDMPAKGNWAHDAIDWAIVNKITAGTSATTFSPSAGCTRSQVVTFLWRAAGEPEPTTNNNPFTDVKEGTFYYKAVLWAVENKVTAGTSATTFSPNAVCTRGQIVTFLWRYEGEPAATTESNPFTDVKAGAYYEKAVLWAAETGVTAGTSATTFSPDNTCTRAQVVTFLYRDMVK